MKTKTVPLPSAYASAIINNDYSGLDSIDRKSLNNELLNNGVIFSDCVEWSEPYIGLVSGAYCELIEYTFRMR